MFCRAADTPERHKLGSDTFHLETASLAGFFPRSFHLDQVRLGRSGGGRRQAGSNLTRPPANTLDNHASTGARIPIRPSENRTKYIDRSYRNLLEWNSEFSNFIQITRFAFIQEEYQYYGNIESDNFTFGKAHSYIGKYDLAYEASKDILLNAVIQNTYTKGEGSSIAENDRNIFSAAILMKHALTDKFQYEMGLRKEATDNYDSPLLYSLGANYEFSDFYSLQFNASRNFRIPTYNDLYWASSGNPELKPETSDQAEIGNIFNIATFELGLTFFYNQIENMIRWVPGADGVWRPGNEDKVKIYGIESYISWQKKLVKDQILSASVNYAYNVSGK